MAVFGVEFFQSRIIIVPGFPSLFYSNGVLLCRFCCCHLVIPGANFQERIPGRTNIGSIEAKVPPFYPDVMMVARRRKEEAANPKEGGYRHKKLVTISHPMKLPTSSHDCNRSIHCQMAITNFVVPYDVAINNRSDKE